LHPLKAGCIDVAFCARYQRAAATLPIGRGKRLMPDPLLRNFAQSFTPPPQARETLVPSAFSKKFNDLQDPKNHRDLGCGCKKYR
jgi:hypothetical protein